MPILIDRHGGTCAAPSRYKASENYVKNKDPPRTLYKGLISHHTVQYTKEQLNASQGGL